MINDNIEEKINLEEKIENIDAEDIQEMNPDPFNNGVGIDGYLLSELLPELPTVDASIADPQKDEVGFDDIQDSDLVTNIDTNSDIGTGEVSNQNTTGHLISLLETRESELLRIRWNDIQRGFIDEPRSAVKEADELVSDVVSLITQMFTKEHSSLEDQWNQGNDVSTEDLRIALQHYRSFFNRLVD